MANELVELAKAGVVAVAKLPIGVAGSVSALIFGGIAAIRVSKEIVDDIPLRLFVGRVGAIALTAGLLIAAISGVFGLVAQKRRLPHRPA